MFALLFAEPSRQCSLIRLCRKPLPRPRYPKDVPRQHNAVDCGVFALMFAEHAARDAPLRFSEADMPLLRLKLAADIVASKVA